MQLNQFNDQSLFELNRNIKQLKEEFARIAYAADDLASPRFHLPGIQMALVDDGEAIDITYGRYGIRLVLTFYREEAVLGGRVTALLTKHPLELKPVTLDSFRFTRSGQTDLAYERANGPVALGDYAVIMALTLVERALLHLPKQASM
jgi:hypothetical protein